MEKIIIRDESIKEAVEAIFDYFAHSIFYSELVDEVLDCSVKVLEDYQDTETCDGDRRPYKLVSDAYEMLKLLKPFAYAIGQGDQDYKQKCSAVTLLDVKK